MLLYVIAVFTFPGIIFHELGHKWMCNILGVKIESFKLFTLTEKGHLGYVRYNRPKKYSSIFLISIAPFLFSSFLSFLFYILAFLTIKEPYFTKFFSWLAFSIAFWALPSYTDSKIIWDETIKEINYNIFVIFAFPITIILFILSFLNNIFFVGSLLSNILIRQLAFFCTNIYI